MRVNYRVLFVLYVVIVMMILCACDDSVDAEEQVESSSSVKNSSSGTLYPESFKPNDEEYPYAGIPRIVIETENRQKIKDRETEIPAKLQIWGEKEAESEIMDLTLRGRGNSSWSIMPKKSYKIEFAKKQSMLGMPKDKDWALIANYADKTLMKNYLMYNLSSELGAFYSPRCEFVELFLNEDYLGVYLLTETIKIAKKRIDIPDDENSYLVEVDGKYRNGEQIVYSDVIQTSYGKNAFRIREPKNASESVLLKIENRIQSFELFLKDIVENTDNRFYQWIDVNDYIRFYWVQEFSKNPDAGFNTSVYFVWKNDSVLKMGPVWDFDISCGGHNDASHIYPEDWYIRDAGWNAYVFKDSVLNQARLDFWIENKNLFVKTLDRIDSIYEFLAPAAQNNLKKWDILGSTSLVYFHFSYSTYEEVVDDLKKWIQKRIEWIDSNIQ